jgi:hypothetical protein
VLQALLSKMTATRGTVHVGGGVTAYVPQSPWVQNLTLRENILFGLPYDEARCARRHAVWDPTPLMCGGLGC